MKPSFKVISFSTEMVLALLAGTKTQTRRTVKKQPTTNEALDAELSFQWDDKQDYPLTLTFNYAGTKKNCINSEAQLPLCEPGDVLWVRETTKVGAWKDEDCKIAFDYKASPELIKTPWVEYDDIDEFNKIHLQSIEELEKSGFEGEIDEENERVYYRWEPGQSPLKWKPSILMPKAAARIFLEVTNVRCERLKDISCQDCKAEGVTFTPSGIPDVDDILALESFMALWESINGKDSWKANPWVWVYEFKKIEKPTIWPQ